MCENIDDGLVCGECSWILVMDWTCPIGVPQGSILGLILFLLYVNDLDQHIENQNYNIFADDAMIYSFGRAIPEIESKLQCALNSRHGRLLRKYRLGISAKKSAVMLIGKQSQVKHSNLAVSINGNLLEQVCSTKYLGVTVDSTLSWDIQCDNLCCKLAGKIVVLRRIQSFVKIETLKLLYGKTSQPVMDYACSVWCHTKSRILTNCSMYKIMLLVLLLATLTI